MIIHRKLPRIETNFNISEHLIEYDVDEIEIKPRSDVPKNIVEIIINWAKEFEIASIKEYYYNRFLSIYKTSLVKSSSRLKLCNRELKTLGMKYESIGSPPTFYRFVIDSKRCKRNYNYEELRGIFF